jgi:hypothetical protein
VSGRWAPARIASDIERRRRWPRSLTRHQADRGQAAIAPYIQGRFDEQRRQGIESASAIRAVGTTPGSRSTAQVDGAGVGTLHKMSRPNGGIMGAVPTNVGVFFGQVDKQASGWYWAGAQSEKLRGAIRRPFETKELAVKDALQSVREAPSDEPQEKGTA